MNKLLISLVVSLGVSGVAYAEGDAEAGKAVSAVCAGCHGADGNSMAPTFPKLAGQNAAYLVKQLKDMKANEERKAPMMLSFAQGLDVEAMENLAAYFAAQTVTAGAATADAETLALGEQIYRAGVSAKGVAACAACHGTDGNGNAQAAFPALKGQHAAYTDAQLKQFRDGLRTNDPSGMMRDTAGKMSDKEIAAVAAYIQAMQ